MRRRNEAALSRAHRLLMYTRPGCGLCHEMREQLEPWSSRPDVEFTQVDISGDASLQERFGLRIPVLFVDGDELCFGRLDADLLREALGSC